MHSPRVMSLPGPLLLRLALSLLALCSALRADTAPEIVPLTLASPLGASYGDSSLQHFDGHDQYWGLKKRLQLDPTVPSLTGETHPYTLNGEIWAATYDRLLVNAYLSPGVFQPQARDLADGALIAPVTLSDGWAFASLGAQAPGSRERLAARLVFRPSPVTPGRQEAGCALVDLDLGSVRILTFGLVPTGLATADAVTGLFLSPGKIAAVFRLTGGRSQLRIFDRNTGSLLAEREPDSVSRILGFSDDFICLLTSGGYFVAPTTLDSLTLLPTGTSYSATVTGAIAGNSVWLAVRASGAASTRFLRYSTLSTLRARVLDDLLLPDPSDTLRAHAAYGPTWLAIHQPTAGAVHFYDLGDQSPLHFPVARLTTTPATEREGRLTATITLDKPAATPTSVRLTSEDASAKAGQDYTPIDLRVTIPAGDLTATVDIPLLEDTLLEPNESFTLRLSQPDHLRPGTGTTPAIIRGTGFGRWERPLASGPVYPDTQLVGTTFGPILAATDTRLAAIVPAGTPNEGKLAIYDLETLRLLKLLTAPLGSGYTTRAAVDLEGSKLRLLNPGSNLTHCLQIDLETGTLETSATLPFAWDEGPLADTHLWQDSRHLIQPTYTGGASHWTLHDLLDPAATRTLPMDGGTIVLTADATRIATLLETRNPAPPWDYLRRIEIRDRATLALLGTIPCAAFTTSPTSTDYPALALAPDTVALTLAGRTAAYHIATAAELWNLDGPHPGSAIPGPSATTRDGFLLLHGGEATDTPGLQIRDLRNGALLDTYDPRRTPSAFSTGGYRLDPSAAGWAGTDGLKAFRLLATPQDPAFLPITATILENLPLAITLVPYERFTGTHPLTCREHPRTQLPAEFADLPGTLTTTPGGADTPFTLHPVNDRTPRAGNRTTQVLFSTAAHPFSLVGTLTATITEDDSTISSSPYAVKAGADPSPAARLAVTADWIASDDGTTIQIHSATTGAHLRTIPVPVTAGSHSLAIHGNRLFYGCPAADFKSGAKILPRVGAVFVYDLTTGQLLATLGNANPKEYFGNSLATSDRWLAVGSILHATTGTWDTTGGSLSVFDMTTLKRVMLKTSTTRGYGQSIALWQDRVYTGAGGTAVTPRGGTKQTNAGSVLGYTLPRGTALPVILPPAPVQYGRFGDTLAIAGNRLAVLQGGWSTGTDLGGVHLYSLPDHALQLSLSPTTPATYGVTANISSPLLLTPGLLSYGPGCTFLDLPTRAFLGTWHPDGNILATDGTWLYWATTGGISRRALSLLPQPNLPLPQPLDSYPSGYTSWAYSFLGGSAPQSTRLPDADPDGDGLTNWQEFATGSHPAQSGKPSSFLYRNQGWLILNYRRANPSIGRPVHPEYSTDLIHWTRQLPPGCETWSQGTQNGIETIEVDINTTATPHLWLRLSFTD
ncbi:Calx-beta domain-containing protein [Luteolibacter sp. LG18]|uniref:Calx-beta domain-containing protein n=1 Tax=Luteolibacter sp. LG18 TaxID=2819286 RepID=UPI002B2A0B6B|nr:hypothetical protein llg_26890 [Luteolibacter sp. LG18]